MPEISSASQVGDDPPTILDVYLSMKRWWWIILLATGLTTTAAVVIAFVIPPTYRSVVLLAPAENIGKQNAGSGLGSLTALRSITRQPDSKAAEALATLESARFTRTFIEQRRLMQDLFADRRDSATGKWVKPIPTLEDGALRFAREVRTVSVDDKTGFVLVAVQWRDAPTAQRWANQLVADLNSEMRERAIIEARADLQFLRARLSEAAIPVLRESLVDLIRDRMETAMLAANRPNYAFRILDPAFQSKYRYQPRRTLIVAGGFVLGIVLSLGLIALVETVRRMRDALRSQR